MSAEDINFLMKLFKSGKISALDFFYKIKPFLFSFSEINLLKIEKIFAHEPASSQREIIDLLEVPKICKVKYLPNEKKFIPISITNFQNLLNFELSKKTTKNLQLVPDIKEVNLSLNLKKNSLFKYVEDNFSESHKNTVKTLFFSGLVALSLSSSVPNINFNFLKDSKKTQSFSKENQNNPLFNLQLALEKEMEEPLILGITDIKKYQKSLSNYPSKKISKILSKLEENKNFQFYKNNLNTEDEINLVKNQIQQFYPHTIDKLDYISEEILRTANKYDLDYKLFLAIIKTESDFKQSAYNPSGDHSIAQINYRIWNKEFKRLNKPELDFHKLKKDISYSVDLMGEILTILKERYDHDPLWYARYHSGTYKRKVGYAKKIQNNIKEMNKQEIHDLIDNLHNFQITWNQLKFQPKEAQIKVSQKVDKSIKFLSKLAKN